MAKSDSLVYGTIIHRVHSIDGQRERFVRLEESSPRLSVTSTPGRMPRTSFSVEAFNSGSRNNSKSFKKGIIKSSEQLKSFGRSIRYGVSRAVFAEDLKKSEKKIFDPQDKFLSRMNKLFLISCILAVSIDPLFSYLPIIDKKANCVPHGAPIAKRYLSRYFIVDFLAVFPLPQIVIWRFLHRSTGSDVLQTKSALLYIVLLQYLPRFLRIIPLMTELERTSGVVAETAWVGAAYYLLWYMLASHIVGAFWYLLSVEREDDCWEQACSKSKTPLCNPNFLYCGNEFLQGYNQWANASSDVLIKTCSLNGHKSQFNFGIYQPALESGVISSQKFLPKLFFCLWWGLKNLSTLGQGLETSVYPGEVRSHSFRPTYR
ncbi:hypothetical protein LUZ60_005140 [Juncus effusus]|nr:hypothetical protein LUZ60_005140 [Juncus effusus]